MKHLDSAEKGFIMKEKIEKICENCGNKFVVDPTYSYVRKCYPCFQAKPTQEEDRVESIDKIAMMAVFKGLTQCRPKNVKIETLIKESKKAYSELFS